MTDTLSYIIKVSASLSVVYLVYFFFLRKLTFYSWNRWYLVVFSLLSFCFPLINISAIMGLISPEKKDVILKIPSIYEMAILNAEKAPGFFELSLNNVLLALLVTGSIIFALRLLFQFISFSRMRRKAKLIVAEPVKIYQVDDKIVPFSFANSIFINQEQHAEEDIKEIIRHEFIHVKQKHSIDMMIGELVCMLNWFNPFAWLIRQSIRQNLEFIADEQVLQQGFDRTQYQYLLLKVIGVSQFSIVSNFNFTSLKKRIAMMNKNRSGKMHLSRFLLLLPVVLILLVAFRKVQQPTVNQAKGVVVDTVPTGKVDPKDIQNIDINKQDNKKMITIRLKDGHVDRYDLNDPKQKDELEMKYGKIQDVAPPPPPPAPPRVTPAPPSPKAPAKKNEKNNPEPPPPPTVAPAPPAPPVPPVPDIKDGDKSVISIFSSKHETAVIEADSVRVHTTKPTVTLRAANGKAPLIILDGKEQKPGTDLDKVISPDKIATVNVLKDDAATQAYGDKGKNVVIVIVSKN